MSVWEHIKNSSPATQAAPAEQWDAPTDSGPISRQWLTVVYRGVEAGDEVQQICTHPKVSAMSWSHALHDRDAARAPADSVLEDAEIDRIVPALEPVSEDFPAEWAVWKDRERIREELRAARKQGANHD